MTETGLFGINGLGFGAYPFQQAQIIPKGTSTVTPLFNSETISQKMASVSTKVGKLEKILKEAGEKLSKAERRKYEDAIKQGKEAIERYKIQMQQTQLNPSQTTVSSQGISRIVKNERGTYDVKFEGEPNRTFSTKADAQKFLDKQLNIKNSQIYPHISGQTYSNMLDSSAPITQKNTSGTSSPWSQGAWDNQRTDLVGELPVNDKQKKTGGSPWSQGAWDNQRTDLNGELPVDKSKVEKKPYVKPEVTVKSKPPKGKGFLTSIKTALKGKKGKAALAAAGIAAVAGAIALFTGKDDNKVNKEEPVKPIVEEPVIKEIPEQQEVIEPEKENQPENLADFTQTMPAAPVEEVAQPENEQTAKGEYEVKKGDSVWKIAEQNLKDLHKDDPDYVPTDKEILMETRRIIENNNLKLEEDKYHVLIKPGDKLNLAV